MAEDNNITHVSLEKYGYFNNRFVFDDGQEVVLVEYLFKASALYYGLSPDEVKSLVYKYAAQQNLNIPRSWVAAKQAGSDWLSGFMKRHSNLSLRTPESTSLSRATSFNRHNVKVFLTNMTLFYKEMASHLTGSGMLMKLAVPLYRNPEKSLLQLVLNKLVLLFLQKEANLSLFVVL